MAFFLLIDTAQKRRIIKKTLPLLICLLFVLTAGGIFLLRAPVLVVVDDSFLQLYGSSRFNTRGILSSLELFRRVIAVPVSEGAGPDLTALAVEGTSSLPRAVLFPYRYREAAVLYSARQPEIQVLVVGEGNALPRDFPEALPGQQVNNNSSLQAKALALGYVQTDNFLDLYRAGLCAALLAGDSGGVLFSYDRQMNERQREAFREGLRARNFTREPAFIWSPADYAAVDGVGCVVISGAASSFLQSNPEIPVILFSWIDPSITPRSVKITFDDSTWALAAELIKKRPSGGEEIFVPSRTALVKSRIAAQKNVRELQKLLRVHP